MVEKSLCTCLNPIEEEKNPNLLMLQLIYHKLKGHSFENSKM